RHYDGEFIIRIEDTDKARHVDEGEASQLNYLKWLGIDWDESVDVGGDYGPYRQSERSHIYKPYINKLLEEDKAYRCYMTAEQLESEHKKELKNRQQVNNGGKPAYSTKEEAEALIAESREPSIRNCLTNDKTSTPNEMVKGDVSFNSKGIGDWV